MRKKVDQKLFHGDSVLASLYSTVSGGGRSVDVTGLHGASRAFVLSLLYRETRRSILAVVPSESEAEAFARDLSFFMGSREVLLYPPWDVRLLSSDDILSLQQEAAQARLRVLTNLIAGGPAVVVATLDALLQRVMPLAVLCDYLEELRPGQRLDRERFVEKLAAGGYRHVSLVEEPGEFSLRGFVLDVFSPAEDAPVRIEFFGDEIESLRLFNPETQRSREERSSAMIAPAGEIVVTGESRDRALRNLRARAADLEVSKKSRDALLDFIESDVVPAAVQLMPLYYDEPGFPNPEALFDYLPGNGLVALFDKSGLEKAEEELNARVDDFLKKARVEERFYLEPSSLLFTMEQIMERCGKHFCLSFEELRRHPGDDGRTLHFSTVSHHGVFQTPGEGRREGEEGPLAPFVESARAWIREGVQVVFLCSEEEVGRLCSLFEGYGLSVEYSKESIFDDLNRGRDRGRFLLKTGRVSEGFYAPFFRLSLVSEEDLFGKKKRRLRRKVSAREGYFLKSFGELKEGDFVVHADHGIGIYKGLRHLSAGGMEADFLNLEYAGGDKLYLPVDRLDRVQRYVGPDGFISPVDRLGGASWETAKKKVKESIRKIAEDLVALYAAREVMEGRSFSMNERTYGEFAASFEYEETPDQARAIEDINLDMTDSKPMDRLVCGDAGFGKTEVAMRAAFRAAMDGTQTALLVPTTILAEQHYRTFSARFADWPIRVEVLDRFKSAKERRAVVEDVKRGLVDIVIGTHSLLRKDVNFRNLGLVIVDEEQRFGVAHKEKLKKLRTTVDVLTLTATPIPRTLQLSLVGLRDLSVIDTAPEGRQAVKVYVAEFEEDLIRDAIVDEISRGGQVYFIHDRVRSIEGMARTLERIVPEARISVIHGRMKAGDIEKVMLSFLKREIDVLVSTTIIGSGVDVPTANTIIINRADRLGLAQLYQLRGRVGRSSESAVAWLLIPRGAVLTKDAKKRLRVAQEFSEPGSGFKVAAYDLEIRGAGNMLGVSQSGHVSAVGYEMYVEMMEKTILELQGKKLAEEPMQPEIQLSVPAFIPEEYVPDAQGRLVLYKKASMADSEEELHDFRDELADRYGPPPQPVENLLAVMDIKIRLKTIRVRELAYDGTRLSLLFAKDTPVSPDKIVALSRQWGKEMHFSAESRLSLRLPGLDNLGRLRESRRIIDLLVGGVKAS